MNEQILQIDFVLKSKGLSSADLFKLMNEKGFKLSKTSISHIITGKHSPKVETLIQIAEALDVDVCDLFKRSKGLDGMALADRMERDLSELKKFL